MKFVDAHTHLETFALRSIPIEKAKSKKDLISMLESARIKPIVAWGWSEELLGDKLSKNDINRFPFPILLIRTDGHMGVVNNKVIEGMRVKPSQKFDPHKGYVYEDVLWSLAAKLKPRDIIQPLLNAQGEAISKGIVEVHDFVDVKTAEAYFKIRERGELKLRVVLMPYYENYRKTTDLIEKYGEDERLSFGCVKVFVDGSIGARTAYLNENYIDKSSRGILLKTERELISTIVELENRGLKIALHAIGDGAMEVAVSALEMSNIKMKGHRIEHAVMIRPSQVRRLKDLGVTICVQPNFNEVFMNTYVRALGEERASRMNPIKMLDEMNADMIFGSDMMPFDPRVGLNYASEILGENKAWYYYGGWKGGSSGGL